MVNQPYLFGILLGISLSIAIESGQQTAKYSRTQENTHRKEQMVAIRDGLFVLVSLLLGFTLTLAVTRFNERRSLVIEEADAIEATYLRAGTLARPYGDHAQQLLRQYIDARIDLDNAGVDQGRIAEVSKRARQIQEELWEGVTELTKTDRSAIKASYINSLTETIELHGRRHAALENRIPLTIWIMIISVSLITVFARGLTLASRFWLTLALAPITIALVVALIADLDTPSAGLIQLDNRAMQRLRGEIRSSQDAPTATHNEN